MEFASTRTSQFSYFDQQLGNPVWKDRRILDFGGNCGGFLVGAADRVDQQNYWCLDIARSVLDEGRTQFPLAHFVHYDRYSAEYNSSGIRHQPVPDFGFEFDFIFAFSVFTHIHRKEMLDIVGQLRRLLTPNGVLAFTFADPAYDTRLPIYPSGIYLFRLLKMLQSNYFPRIQTEDIVERARNSEWSILIDDQLHVEPDDDLCHQERPGGPVKTYCAFYSVDYMASLFPEGTILPPVGQEWQHCCILRKT